MGGRGRLLALGGLAVVTACGGNQGVAGIVGGPVPPGTSLPVEAGPSPPAPTVAPGTAPGPGPVAGPTSVVPAPGPAAPGPAAPAPSGGSVPAPAPGPGPAAPAPGGLRLGGDDLGVTRVGAPFGGAVAAVARALGPPAANPAADTACIGAEEEASWGSFRLAGSGGRVSGWLSTGTAAATPAGVTAGTTLPALRQAYGTRLEVRPPAPDTDAVFLVAGDRLGGTLTGTTPSDTVRSLFNGTCEAQ